jgi:hypothetical protein
MVRTRAWAVLRLMKNSNFAGCSTVGGASGQSRPEWRGSVLPAHASPAGPQNDSTRVDAGGVAGVIQPCLKFVSSF